jgi:hypothetical protein
MAANIKTYDEFLKSQEYFLCGALHEYVEANDFRQSDLVSKHDVVEFWEPFLECVYKLGVVYKQTAKMKELKVKWMRPIFYIMDESKVVVDGKTYEPPKESLDAGQEVRRRLGNFCEIIERYPKIEPSNWKAFRKELKAASADMWKTIIRYVTKVGFRELNEVLKWILEPLLLLRKASLNLFKLEMQESGVGDFVLFNNKSDCITYINNVKDTFKEHEDRKFMREMPLEELEKYVEKVVEKEQYMYKFREDFVVPEEVKDEMKIVNFKFQKDALQAEFEKGLTAVFKYFNEKESNDFYDIPDVRKLFINLTVKEYNKRKSLSYYIDDMNRRVFLLKVMLYEMKMNGMSRIQIPIRANKNFTSSCKEIFYLYHKMDRLFGNYLSYDQYLFFYECLNKLQHSNFNLRNEVELLKVREFVEDSLPKYIVLQAMRKAVKIEQRIRDYLNEQGNLFFRKDYFQITQYELDNQYTEYIYDYDTKRNPLYGTAICDELNVVIKNLEEEIVKYGGRYWILEGFFNSKQDKEDWINAIEILRNINDLVQDDIRDYILQLHREKEKEGLSKPKERKESHRSGSKKTFGSSNSLSKINPKERVTSGKDRRKSKKGTHNLAKRMDTNHSIESDDDSIINTKKTDFKADNLRPPYVWNFPIEDIKMQQFLKSQNKENKLLDDNIMTMDVRKVDPRDFYKDGRVREFLKLLDKLTYRMLEYSEKDKYNIFVFFLECTFNSLDIYYYNQRAN